VFNQFQEIMIHDIELFNKAVVFATNTHNTRKRKGDKRPYILHPLSVAKRIFDNGFDKPYLKAIVAILHDCVEDEFEDNYEEGFKIIGELFGEEVLSLVKELTLNKEKYKLLGKNEYLLQELTHMSSDALDVKLCDREDNVEEMNDMDSDFQIYYTKHTRFVFKNLKRDFTEKQKVLVEKIISIVSYFESLHQLN
jgi:GTP diphosphokinase / guanosine-3',5'-bis(diphosphate) 3'-diphosphatase